ncbi:hypothetical protein [Staphylococcus warneri]|nr:hypothetical protein [Staphylococcus warneri]QNQ44308.1 hypothetical protein IAR39_10895 [Staphylococcus warneri]
MDIQDKLKLKLQFFADESNEVDENNDEPIDEEGEEKTKRLIQKKSLTNA